MYKKQLSEAKAEILKEQQEAVKSAIKKRLKEIDECNIKIERLKKEVDQLVREGKIKDMSTLVTSGEGLYTLSGSGSSCVTIAR